VDYAAGPKGLRLNAVGAHARHAGRFDSAKYFTPQARETRS